MRQSTIFAASKLSPYAQALKQVALRGAGALGLSAKEQEAEMYRQGTLPADYRPPVQGAWDDTVERWAYAWQFPAEEDVAVEGVAYDSLAIAQDSSLLEPLLEVCQLIADSRFGRSGGVDGLTPEPITPTVGPDAAHIDRAMLLDNPAEVPRDQNQASALTDDKNDEKGPSAERETEELLSIVAAGDTADKAAGVSPEAESACDEEAFLVQLKQAAQSLGGTAEGGLLSRLQPLKITADRLPPGVPMAYIYDGSEVSRLSVRLGQLMVDQLDLTYDADGITTAMFALGYANRPEMARSLFTLAVKGLGFTATAPMFNALMYPYAHRGDVNQVMAIIEEMKAEGITPIRHSWHLLMVGFSRAGDHSAVTQVVDNMKAYACIEPDETTFALHLYALSKDRSRESSVPEAIQLFDQMENVYGYVASRPHYHALMGALMTRRREDYRERVEMLGKKMELIGIPWSHTTFAIQVRTAQLWGDISKVKQLFAKARDEGIPASSSLYSWVIRTYANSMILNVDYADYKARGVSPEPAIQQHLRHCYDIFELIVRRGQEVTRPLVDALLFASTQAAAMALEHCGDGPGDGALVSVKYDLEAERIWNELYSAHGLEPSVYSYQIFIQHLANQQRIDEAEKLFQDLVLTHDLTPTQPTYVSLMMMHLASGEEGGTARALQYMDAMERSNMPIRSDLVKRFVRVNNEAGYKRDMKRRARRIVQAREEYLARRKENEEGIFNDAFLRPVAGLHEQAKAKAKSDDEAGPKPTSRDIVPQGSGAGDTPVTSSSRAGVDVYMTDPRTAVGFTETASPMDLAEKTQVAAVPLPLDPNSTLAWWDRWRKESISKHELFEGEAEDGMPRGETDADRKHALRAMGIQPLERADMPRKDAHTLLPALRKDGSEPAGALWAMDGGELSYPSDGQGPEGWGVRLWRDRRIIAKDLQRRLDGHGTLPELSSAGVGARVVSDQLAVEEGKLRTPGELADYHTHPHHVYDDGSLKPTSEHAVEVPPTAEFVWKQEERDELAPYKTQSELSMESEDYFTDKLRKDAKGQVHDAIEAIKSKQEDVTVIEGATLARRKKHDYLEKWREMYSQGTLEVADEPVVKFGRSPGDHIGSMAGAVEAWFESRKRRPRSDAEVEAIAEEVRRRQDARASRQASRDHSNNKRFKQKSERRAKRSKKAGSKET